MITEADIVRTVENYYNVSYKNIRTRNNMRYPENVARDMVIFLFRDILKMKLRVIAATFNISVRCVEYHLHQMEKQMMQKGKAEREYREIMAELNN